METLISETPAATFNHQGDISAHGLWRQRLGYGVADFSCNLIWVMITLYLMYFYTDVMGLTAVQVGVLFLVTRLFDGFADVAMGVLIDKTNTRWGQSRPYFLIGAIPFGLLALLAFYVPPFGPAGKLVYAYLTYLGLSLAYTVVNIPLASILPNLTSDAHERTVLATTRIIFSFVGATVVSVCTLRLVRLLGHGSQASGFFRTMLIFASVGACMFVVTFKNVQERTRVQHQTVTIRQAFSALKGNTPWYLFAVNIIFMWGSYFFQQGALIYYFTYNIGRRDLASVFAGISSILPIVGTFATPFFAKRMHKQTLFMISSLVNLAGIVVMFIANKNIAGLEVGAVIAAVGFGTRQSIYFSMQADPIDFGEWKSGISAAGVISSCNGFIGKVAMASAGAISGLLLTWSHYSPNTTQSSSALLAIKLNYLVIPAVMVIISMGIMCFYNLDRIFPKIRAEIDERHRLKLV